MIKVCHIGIVPIAIDYENEYTVIDVVTPKDNDAYLKMLAGNMQSLRLIPTDDTPLHFVLWYPSDYQLDHDPMEIVAQAWRSCKVNGVPFLLWDSCGSKLVDIDSAMSGEK